MRRSTKFFFSRPLKISWENILRENAPIQPNQFVLLSAPVQVREISKEGQERRPNDANNDSAEGDLPVFEPTAANVSAFVGQTVYLPCRVRNLGDKVVSRSNFLPKRN